MLEIFGWVVLAGLVFVLGGWLFVYTIEASTQAEGHGRAWRYGGALFLLVTCSVTALLYVANTDAESRPAIVCSAGAAARVETRCSRFLVGGVWHTHCVDHCWCGPDDLGIAVSCTEGTEPIRPAAR